MRFTLRSAHFAAPLLLTFGLASCATPPTGGGPAPALAASVVGGGSHTCALLTDQSVSCWGSNVSGELGNTTNNGTNTANPTPTKLGLAGVIQITAGSKHTCALLTNHTVTCWGNNHYGQLGNTTNNGTDNANPTPTPVAGLTGVTQISAGYLDTCARLTDGTADCWGANQSGQLGIHTNAGSNNPNPTPTAVTGLTGVTQIAAGKDNSCALLTDQTVTCWGSNFYGESGINGLGDSNPTAITGLTDVTQITASYGHSCALLTDQTVTCWGRNNHGQLGNTTNNGTDNANPTPTAVAGLTGVTQITTGFEHNCARLMNGTLTCWGWNGYGQLGTTTNSGSFASNPTPTAVAGLAGAQIGGSEYHTCAVLTDGTVSCWGLNHLGQLGNTTNNGTENANPTPTTVAGIP
jgi:alpha-tubulin suppressor-like RCC1 family protein